MDSIAEKDRCSKCGAELIPGSSFCNNCGAIIETENNQYCVECGKQIVGNMKFCPFCGAERLEKKEPNLFNAHNNMVNEQLHADKNDERLDIEQETADEITKKIDEFNIEKKKRKKLIIIVAAIVLVVAGISCGVLYYNGVKDEETLKALSKSLEDATFYSYGSSYGERQEFGSDGKVYWASDPDGDGEYSGSFMYYGVTQLSDGRYGIDVCVSEEGLFKAGEDRMYIVTETDNNEIVSYERQNYDGDTTTFSRE